MIYIGAGANLPGRFNAPEQAILASKDALAAEGIRIVKSSPVYQTPPMGPAGQPPYMNAVFEVHTHQSPGVLLDNLHKIETAFGRKRRERWGARVLDLDLIDYQGLKQPHRPVLPHPSIADRAFVLVPLRDIAPNWRHPVSGKAIDTLISAFSDGELAKLRCLPS